MPALENQYEPFALCLYINNLVQFTNEKLEQFNQPVMPQLRTMIIQGFMFSHCTYITITITFFNPITFCRGAFTCSTAIIWLWTCDSSATTQSVNCELVIQPKFKNKDVHHNTCSTHRVNITFNNFTPPHYRHFLRI